MGTDFNAATLSATDVQTAINSAQAGCGNRVILPSGSGTWSTQVTVTPHTGCTSFTGTGSPSLTILGATTCTPGAAGSKATSCTDNTNITLSNAGNQSLSVSGVTDTAFFELSGVTLITGVAFSNGLAQVDGTHGKVGFRLDHIHLKGTTSNALFWNIIRGVWGLADHLVFDDSTAAAPPSIPFNMLGDLGTAGYLDWAQPTNIGSKEAVYIEDSTFNYIHSGSEGIYDCYEGAKVVLRYSTVVGNFVGGCHGTDSGPFRSAVLQEMYNLTIDNNTASGIFAITNSRGGVELFHDNVVTKSGGGSFGSNPLQIYRIDLTNDVGTWGTVGKGLNWVGTSANGSTNSLNAPDWTATNAYSGCPSSCAVIAPTSNNAGGYNYQIGSNCTSSGSRPAFTQTFGGTTPDGTCTWTMVGGSKTAGTQKWCAANRDTQCTADATCNALQVGDTCSTFFDASGGGCPARDQPGRTHNQTLTPIYAWNNSGAGLPSPVFAPVGAGTSACLTSGVDYFNNAQMPGYVPFTYPHPLQGAVAPTIPPAPALNMLTLNIH